MIKNFSIKKFFSGLLKKNNGSIGDRSIMHPEREWFFGVLGGAIFLAAGVVWSISIYSQFSNVSTETTTEITDGNTYREELVESALSDLAERERSYKVLEADLLNSSSPVFSESESEEVISEESPVAEEELDSEPEEESLNEDEPVVGINETPSLAN